MEQTVTFVASLTAIWFARDRMTMALFAVWVMGIHVGLLLTMSWLPTAFAVLSLALALFCLNQWTSYESQRARLIGSVALFQCGMCYAVSHARADWYFFALSMNASFVLQCLIGSGACDGVGRISGGFHRLYRNLRLRGRGHVGRH
jgi:hypothetical protein